MPPTTSSMQDVQPTTETDKHTTGDQDVQCLNPTPSIPMEYTSKLLKFLILCYLNTATIVFAKRNKYQTDFLCKVCLKFV